MAVIELGLGVLRWNRTEKSMEELHRLAMMSKLTKQAVEAEIIRQMKTVVHQKYQRVHRLADSNRQGPKCGRGSGR